MIAVNGRTGEQVTANEPTSRALIEHGEQERRKGRYAEALALYVSAQTAAERVDDTVAVAAALTGIANVHAARGAYDLALEHAQRSLTLRPESDRSAEAAGALLVIGSVRRFQGDYDAALDYYQRTLAIQQHLGDPLGVGGALSAIGIIHRRQGRFEEAASHYERALVILRQTPDAAQTARTLNNLGVLHVARGDYDAALIAYRESLPLHEMLGHAPDVASTLTNMGVAHRLQGNNRLALEYYQKSLAITERTGNRSVLADTLSEIGVLYASQGHAVLAMEYYQKAFALHEASGHRGQTALMQSYMASLLTDRGEYDAALALHERALQTREAIGDRPTAAASWGHLGALHEQRGALDRAVECWNTSLRIHEEVGNRQGVTNVLTQLSRGFARQGQHARALETAERAVALSRATGARRSLRQALVRAGQARHALGQRAQAHEAFNEAISVAESLRDDAAGGESERQLAFEASVMPYQAMVTLLVEEGRPADALLMAERAKARVLLDVLGQGRINITKAMTTQEVQDEREIERELIALNAEIAYRSLGSGRNDALAADLARRLQATQTRRQAFHAGLYSAHPELKVQRSDAPPLTLADAGALLSDARTALLEFVVGSDVTYAFVLTRDPARASGVDVTVSPIRISRRELTTRTERLRNQMAARDPAFRDASAALSELLLASARAHLKQTSRLIIVPDGVLWELPFQALWQSDSNGYLLESHAISYAPSMTVLREMTRLRRTRVPHDPKAPDRAPRLLAFANPHLPASNRSVTSGTTREAPLAPLPHADLEVRSLARVYGAAGSRIYHGSDAREDRWKAESGGFGVLHLATHGVLDAASPMYSYLALAPSAREPHGREPAEDGLLQAWEIMKLDLQADLVVLSGCETARGRVAAGEGMIGLSWALFVAGSPASIVSQWKVESASTAQLMQTFHRAWRAPNRAAGTRLSKAEALQQAALPLLRSVRNRHPFYWGAFVLVGDGS